MGSHGVSDMFDIVRKNLFRWGTPDPETDEMMYGHLVVRDEGCVLIDPPFVPGLLENIGRLGKLEAILITTLDHIRGVKYISKKTKADFYIPDQAKSMTIDPDKYISWAGLTEYKKYDASEQIYGVRPFRITVEGRSSESEPYMDEYAFLTDKKELIAGDIAVGSEDGRLLIAPEWFPTPHEPHIPAHRAFRDLVVRSGAETLLTSHGSCLFGNLKELTIEI